MPFCPNCRYEYRSEVFVCPDCNVELTSTLPSKGASSGAAVPDDSWVSVAMISTEMSAEMVRGALESNNIPSVVVSSSFGAYSGKGNVPILQAAGGGSNLVMVPREFQDEAVVVMEAILGDDYEIGRD